METPFKLKTFTDIRKLHGNSDELINYIDRLHSIIRDYQIVIDVAVDKNRKIK